jgi:hypothetical protein
MTVVVVRKRIMSALGERGDTILGSKLNGANSGRGAVPRAGILEGTIGVE